MSISLNLILYPHRDGELVEENLKTVRCEDISQSLLDKINSTFSMQTQKVYFDDTLEEYFEIECFKRLDIEGVSKQLKEIFLELLQFENDQLNNGGNGSLSKKKNSNNSIECIYSDDQHTNKTDLAITRFRVLTGIIGIFIDAQTKYSDEIGAVIKLG